MCVGGGGINRGGGLEIDDRYDDDLRQQKHPGVVHAHRPKVGGKSRLKSYVTAGRYLCSASFTVDSASYWVSQCPLQLSLSLSLTHTHTHTHRA